MDYSKQIKSCLEDSAILRQSLTDIHLDVTHLLTASPQHNLCCANASYLFIYVESAASFLALSFNRLCKSTETGATATTAVQRLSINVSPVGTFKKCTINSKGTHILVVYDKCLFVVELPSRWGKYDQFNGGSSTTMCKSIKIPHTGGIVDAVWHSGADLTRVVCLTEDNFLRMFECEGGLKSPVKEYHMQGIFGDECGPGRRRQQRRGVSIDMGARMMFNGKQAYPIYVLKASGRVECLVDYESLVRFV